MLNDTRHSLVRRPEQVTKLLLKSICVNVLKSQQGRHPLFGHRRIDQAAAEHFDTKGIGRLGHPGRDKNDDGTNRHEGRTLSPPDAWSAATDWSACRPLH